MRCSLTPAFISVAAINHPGDTVLDLSRNRRSFSNLRRAAKRQSNALIDFMVRRIAALLPTSTENRIGIFRVLAGRLQPGFAVIGRQS